MKTLALAIGLSFFTMAASAQMSVIPKAGLAITSADVDPEIGSQHSRESFFFGLGVEAKVTPLFSIQPELLYLQKGVDWDVLIAESSRRIHYIELPVMLKVNLPLSDFLLIYLNAGPSFGLALSGEDKGSAFGFSGSTDLKFGSADDEFKSTDVGLQVGAGIGYTLGTGNLLLDFRYGHGLTNLRNNDAVFKNRTVAVSVGYAFPIGVVGAN